MNGTGLTEPPEREAPIGEKVQWLVDAAHTTYARGEEEREQRAACQENCAKYRKANNDEHRVFWRVIWGTGGGITVAGVLLKAFGVL